MAKKPRKHHKVKRISGKAGLPPGSVVMVGEQKVTEPHISCVQYNIDTVNAFPDTSWNECLNEFQYDLNNWINIDGLHDTRLVEQVGQQFNIHPLTIEDILNTHQRPKADIFADYLFIVVKTFVYHKDSKKLTIDQVSMLVKDNVLITFQEIAGDEFDGVRNRLQSERSRLRINRIDYLLHSLLDAIIDNYFNIVEQINDDIEALEETLINNPDSSTLKTIHLLKHDLIILRKSIWPLREIINKLVRDECPIVQVSTHIYLRDLYDHIVQIMDYIDSSREVVAAMLDVYLSSMSNHLNEIMKILTIFTTIFIPLTFIVGVYGMNFHYMPELSWKWGYASVWILMAVIVVVMLRFFRRKHWL